MAKVYVETLIDAPLDRIWAATQDYRQHTRWDARFGRIDPVPGSAPIPTDVPATGLPTTGEHAAFTYATAVLPWVEIAGYGVHTGDRHGPGGATSALRFGSDDRRSVISDGAGYWRYATTSNGVRFLTGYSYRTRWGRAGRAVDLAFGPVFGWATAWSFDRLRLWLEAGVSPERARLHAMTELLLRAALVAGAVAVDGRPLVVLAAAALATGVPPHPHTPAARRCRRRPGQDDPR
jgi:hypothetical protein